MDGKTVRDKHLKNITYRVQFS